MKKILYAVLATVSAVVLLFTYRTSHIEDAASVAAAPTGAASAGSTGTGSSSSGFSSGSGSSSGTGTGTGTGTGDTETADPAAGAASTSSSGLRDGTYTGSAASTRFGPVQVQITVTGGVIADVQVPEYPSTNPRDRQINERALPTLISETTEAQSADIDMVSGATYTSRGYLTSLQSAIDQAHA